MMAKTNSHYDVFISYRRSTGENDARLLQQALKARGYEVFFNYDSLRDGKFDEKIFEAIEEASVFILMLTEGALDGCANEEDWVRAEIERAIDNGKQIIPVLPSNQKLSFPDNLPPKLRDIPLLQVSELNKSSLFNESVDKIVQDSFPDCLARRRSSPYNKPPHDIFISYSRKNKDAVLPIKDEIERLGLTCWIDLSDIPCGTENFKKKVIPGIRQLHVAFLFFLSAESQSSEYAMKEINFAKKRAKKRVILVRFNDDEMTDEFYFDFQDTDIIDWRVLEQKEKLLRDLKSWSDNDEQGCVNEQSVCNDGTGSTRGRLQMYGGIPLREIDKSVERQFAHFLYAKKGWSEFSVVVFESRNEYLKAFMVRNSQGMPVRITWLQGLELYQLFDLDEVEFDVQAGAVFNRPTIAAG